MVAAANIFLSHEQRIAYCLLDGSRGGGEEDEGAASTFGLGMPDEVY